MKKFNVLLTTALVAGGLSLSACSKADVDTMAETAPAATSKMADKMADVKSMAAEMEMAKAVFIHADWCGSCKILEPKVTSIRDGFEGKGITFVTLDYTDKDQDGFYAQAEAAGVATAIRAALGDNVKTGQMFIVSADGSKVLSTVNKTNTPMEIAARLKDAVSG